MTTVIDVGCARYNGDFSLERLAEEFKPDQLIGFDPNWAWGMTVPEVQRLTIYAGAAWTYNGSVGIDTTNLYAQVNPSPPLEARRVPCWDLATVIAEIEDKRIILKIDAEGSEYELLDHLIHTCTDALLELAWVEFHDFGVEDPAARRAMIEEEIACELRDWNW
jgi:FkbM family methyltransferase